MRITPLDVRKQEFRRGMRGLDPEEVYAFLSTVADEYESVLNDNKALRERLLELDDKVQEYRTMEKTLRDTLLTAERVNAEAKDNARREATIIIKEAQIEAEKALGDIKTEAMKLRAQVQQLRSQRDAYLARMKVVAESHLSTIRSSVEDFRSEDRELEDLDLSEEQLADQPIERNPVTPPRPEGNLFDAARDVAGDTAPMRSPEPPATPTRPAPPAPQAAPATPQSPPPQSTTPPPSDAAAPRSTPATAPAPEPTAPPTPAPSRPVESSARPAQSPRSAPAPRPMDPAPRPADTAPRSEAPSPHARAQAEGGGLFAGSVDPISVIIDRMKKGQQEILSSGAGTPGALENTTGAETNQPQTAVALPESDAESDADVTSEFDLDEIRRELAAEERGER